MYFHKVPERRISKTASVPGITGRKSFATTRSALSAQAPQRRASETIRPNATDIDVARRAAPPLPVPRPLRVDALPSAHVARAPLISVHCPRYQETDVTSISDGCPVDRKLNARPSPESVDRLVHSR